MADQPKDANQIAFAMLAVFLAPTLGLRCPHVVMQTPQTPMDIQRLKEQNEAMRNRLGNPQMPPAYYASPYMPDAAPPPAESMSRRDVIPLAIGGGVLGAASVAALSSFLGDKAAEPAAAPVEAALESLVSDIRAGTAESEAARAKVVSELAEAATEKYFPGSMAGGAVDAAVAATLAKRGYTPANTLFASSVCPDEVNHGPGDLEERMKSRWGEEFYLGGLAGVPFVGSAGFTAYAHHSPTGGKLLVLFAPHIGISADGTVGALSRVGQKNAISKACGATIGSLKAVAKRAQAAMLGEDAPPPPPPATYYDRMRNEQLGLIIDQLEARMADQPKDANQIAFATYQMYNVIREQFVEQLVAAGESVWDDATELTILGGIMINRAEGGDRFLPLNFESRMAVGGETTVDLFSEAFGPKRSDLSKALGSMSKSNAAYMPYSLTKLGADGSAVPLYD